MQGPDPRLDLVACALKDLHSSWLPDLDSELVMGARCSRSGSLWLLRMLSEIDLFALPPNALIINSSALSGCGWWQSAWSSTDDRIVYLGARGYHGVIRSAISRDRVLQWRRVLGQELYVHLLGLPPIAEVDTKAGDVASASLSDEAWLEKIQYAGFRSLHEFAGQLDPLLARRVALAFPQAWSATSNEECEAPLLPSEVVEELVNQWSNH